jgi:hypothetical protein
MLMEHYFKMLFYFIYSSSDTNIYMKNKLMYALCQDIMRKHNEHVYDLRNKFMASFKPCNITLTCIVQ